MKDQNRPSVPLEDLHQDENLAKLLRTAGSRSAAPEDLAKRVEQNVRSHWNKTIRVRKAVRFILVLSSSVAACLLLYIFSLDRLAKEVPVPVGIVENLSGNVFVTSKENIEGPNGFLRRSDVLIAGSTLESGESGRLLMRLLGGVTLRMDANSRVRIVSESNFVLDQGAVYFDSGNRRSSVTLLTGIGTVQDTGTQFEVRLQKESIRIRVREGSISFQAKGVSKTANAGTELAVDTTGKASQNSISKYGEDWDWVSEVLPTFRLEGRSLMEFLTWVSRENGWTLRFESPHIRDSANKIILHGSIAGFSSSESPAAILSVSGLSYDLDEGIFTVRQRSLDEGNRNESSF
jgi:hypothetical protein